MAARFAHDERNQDATIYIGGIDEKTTNSLVWELMLQVGPVVSVHLPKDRVSQTHQGYGFVEFQMEEDADYAMKIMNGIKIFGRPIRVNKASADKKANINIGADLHISGLDPSLDERTLLTIFSSFGPLMNAPRVFSPPPQPPKFLSLQLTIDCTGRIRPKQGLRNNLLHRFHRLRRRTRLHEWPIPRRKTHLHILRLQKGRPKGGTTWLHGRTKTRRLGQEE
jgi:RNA recognition motif-containing protein